MDTVLIGGFSVLVFFGVIWLAHSTLEKSKLSPTAKRVGNYALVACVVGAAAIAIDWHAANWMASRV